MNEQRSEDQIAQVLEPAGKYRIAVHCMNCSYDSHVTLPKGVEFNRFVERCARCGCSTLLRSAK